MKKISIIVSMITLCIGFSTTASAQATGSATGSATIITPISILNAGDMNFGNFATTTAVGTVILAPAGSRTITGGVTLPGTVGTVTAAKFTVSGQAYYTYAVTVPTGAYTLTKAAGTETMTVNAFTSTTLNNSGTAAGLLTLGVDTISVGATLNVGTSQVAGAYTNATGFPVTVNYN